jgi:hypothetical protein
MTQTATAPASGQMFGTNAKIRSFFSKVAADLAELYTYSDRTSAAVTATTGGGTTGLIPAAANFVTVTSDSANKQISLPAASVGKRLTIKVGSTACELISAVAAHTLNNVLIGATNEAVLTANNTYWLEYVAANTWIMTGYTNLGAVQTAVIPDAL